jgi:hypothetical protein
MARRISTLINKVAKLPARESYLWDEHTSLIAAVLFHVVTLLSPLGHAVTLGRTRARSPRFPRGRRHLA